MKDFSYITNSHPAFIEETYKAFVQDPSSVDPDLKKFLKALILPFLMDMQALAQLLLQLLLLQRVVQVSIGKKKLMYTALF